MRMAGPRKYYYDLHIHTRRYSPCSIIEPAEVIAAARARGLDGIALTEHGVRWPAPEIEELKAECGRASFPLLVGCEISTRSGDGGTGDLLVFGLSEVPDGPCSIDEVCRRAHGQGGVVVAPHPFAEIQGIRDEVYSSRIDGIEVYNHRYRGSRQIRLAEKAWRQLDLVGVAGSDAHEISEIGRCCTEFDDPLRTERDLIEAILARRCRPRPKSPPSGLLRMLGLGSRE